MSAYARIVDGVAVEVWTDGGLDIGPADVFVPGLAEQFEPVPGEVHAGWSLIDGIWTAPPPAPEPELQSQITRLAFLSRFTDEEAIALDLASQGATVEAATLRRYLSKVNAASFIDLSREDTRAGVLALGQIGILAEGRALEILDAPVQSHEVPR